jgi:hypothetical protein
MIRALILAKVSVAPELGSVSTPAKSMFSVALAVSVRDDHHATSAAPATVPLISDAP